MIPANILAEAGKVILPKLIGAGLSYAQAAQQNTLFGEAQKAADIAIQEAKGFAAINEMEALRIPMEAYENSQREITSQQQQAVDALQQTGARGLLGGLGGVQALAVNANQQQRDQIARDLYNREVAVASNEERNNNELQLIAEKEAAGNQEAAAQAQEQRGAALSSGTEALTGAITGAFGNEFLNPLYGFLENAAATRKIKKYVKNKGFGGVTSQPAGSGMGGGLNFSGGNDYGFKPE
tara:strand:+ start:168 stop:884 length:717 start_codon:yes stop_codon:yes gene_type:complete